MKVRAINLTSDTKVKDLLSKIKHKRIYKNAYESVFKTNKNGYLIVYNFGVLVQFNDTSEDDISTLLTTNIRDDYQVKRGKRLRATDNYIVVPKVNLDIVRQISLILAESVALDYYESIAEDILNRNLEFSRELKTTGRCPKKTKELYKFIGHCSTIRQEILNNLYIGDLPDSAWDDPELEKIFKSLSNVFDLQNRVKTINQILNSVHQTNSEMIGLIHNKKAAFLELTIIGLFLFEIIINLVEKL